MRDILPVGARVLDAGPLPFTVLPESARSSDDALIGMALFLGAATRDFRSTVPQRATFQLIELPLERLDHAVTHSLADLDDCGEAGCTEDHRGKVLSMAAALRGGADLPPVVIGTVPGKPDVRPYLIDGFHRTMAHFHAGRKSIRAHLLLPRTEARTQTAASLLSEG